jgi:sporulation-control protein spo0M
MSFFKRIKDKLTPPEANVSLRFNKTSFVAGENVEGVLTVNSGDEFDAMEVRCEIQCVEEAKKIRHVYEERLHHEVDREFWDSATLFSLKPSLSGPMHLSNGFTKDFPFSVNIPVSGPATCKSLDRKVTWSLKGVIAIDGRPDVTSRTMEIQVAPPSAAPVIREKEIIREVVMVPCKYCSGLMPQTETSCPHCGAKRTV